jgi:hypothetical protein
MLLYDAGVPEFAFSAHPCYHFAMTTTEALQQLSKLEKNLLKLKKETALSFDKKPISLKGFLKGTKITEKDIKEAKKSLFQTTKI